MKILKIHLFVLLFTFGCTLDTIDPNAASEEQVLNTRDGLVAAGIGLRAYYSTNSLLWIIENNALTTREVSVTSSFQTANELEQGMEDLTSFNSNITNQWSSLLKVQSMANNIIDRVDLVSALISEKNTIKAQALFFRAVATGFLAQSFTHVPWNDGESIGFITNTEAYKKCINSLTMADDILSTTTIDQSLVEELCGDQFDLENSIKVYLSRYQLFNGDYQGVINTLTAINENAISIFGYSNDSPNPIFNRVFGSNLYYQPIDNFGLPIMVDPSDERLSFYLEMQDKKSVTGSNIEILKGFYDSPNTAIPVYLLGEIFLNRAEALLFLDQIPDAIDEINKIRTKINDPLGVNASLPPYTEDSDPVAVIKEIYYQRCIELFMSGLRLEDSRRLNRPGPLSNEHGPLDRTRNYYPFPETERSNNANTPENPAI